QDPPLARRGLVADDVARAAAGLGAGRRLERRVGPAAFDPARGAEALGGELAPAEDAFQKSRQLGIRDGVDGEGGACGTEGEEAEKEDEPRERSFFVEHGAGVYRTGASRSVGVFGGGRGDRFGGRDRELLVVAVLALDLDASDHEEEHLGGAGEVSPRRQPDLVVDPAALEERPGPLLEAQETARPDAHAVEELRVDPPGLAGALADPG